MTEEDARERVTMLVSEDAMKRLDALARLVTEENDRQNLIGQSTVASLWQRHVFDSIQLLSLAKIGWQHWLDIGTGGGFPGLAIACTTARPVTLVEPRSRRAAFLDEAAARLGLSNVDVRQQKIEQVAVAVDVISARAVASPFLLLRQAQNCATHMTQWLLPVGRWSDDDTSLLAKAQPAMMFHVEQSLTKATSAVLVGYGKPA